MGGLYFAAAQRLTRACALPRPKAWRHAGLSRKTSVLRRKKPSQNPSRSAQTQILKRGSVRALF